MQPPRANWFDDAAMTRGEMFGTLADLRKERDRLKALNAELVEALEQLAVLGEVGMKPDPAEWITFHDKVAQIARAALAKAKGN